MINEFRESQTQKGIVIDRARREVLRVYDKDDMQMVLDRLNTVAPCVTGNPAELEGASS